MLGGPRREDMRLRLILGFKVMYYISLGFDICILITLIDSPTTIQTPPQGYPPSSSHEQNFHFPASPHLPAHPVTQDAHYASSEVMRPGSNASASSNGSYHPSYIGGQHTAELDAQYWKNMFLDLGFGGNVEQAGPPQATGHSNGDLRSSYDVRHQHQAYHITQSSHPSY